VGYIPKAQYVDRVGGVSLGVARAEDSWFERRGQGVRPYFVIGSVVLCVAAAALTVACDINPQPEVPSDNEDGTGGEGGAAGGGSLSPPPTQDDDNASYANVDQPGVNNQKTDEEDDAGADDARGDGSDPGEYRGEDAGIPGVVVN
jgi:hypothetical protein